MHFHEFHFTSPDEILGGVKLSLHFLVTVARVLVEEERVSLLQAAATSF
jgi:hypothetical protein